MLNIIGDSVAIFALDMGIKGAAYATILGQFVSFCICAAYLTRSRSFRLSLSSFWLDWRLLKQVMALGASSFLTQLSIVIVTIVNNILLVKYGALSPYGPDIPLGAFVVILKLFQIVLNIAIGIAAGSQPIVGYNYGAKKFGRVRELLVLMIKWTVIVCLICTLLFEAFPLVFIRMFGADGELYTQFAVQCLRIYLSLILFTCVQKVCAIFLQSIGHARAAAPLSILRDVLLILFSIFMPRFFGVTGIFWGAPMADVLAIVLVVNLVCFGPMYAIVSGVLNACTYIGSALSTYVFALAAQRFGWRVTVLCWAGVCVLGAAACTLGGPRCRRMLAGLKKGME